MASARNLGGSPKDANDAYQVLVNNATESTTDDFDGEKGVVDECNAIRVGMEKQLNAKK